MNPRRLPDDPAYWEALASRIEQAAWDDRDVTRTTVGWLSERAAFIAGVSVAAAAVLVVLAGNMGVTRSEPELAGSEWAAVFAPTDSLGRQVASARPPAFTQLLAGAAARGLRGTP